MTKALLGEIINEGDDPRVEIKSQQLEALERKIKEKKAEIAEMESAGKAIASRLYACLLALQAFFEIHDAPAGNVPASAAPGQSDKWEKVKAKVGGKMAEVVAALQLVGTATRTQLKNQTGGALTTIDTAIYKLRDMGLIVKNGDGWSLKP